MKHTFSNWTWHDEVDWGFVDQSEEPLFHEASCQEWIDKSKHTANNVLTVHVLEEPALSGSLIYQQSEQEEQMLFHFFVTEQQLITNAFYVNTMNKAEMIQRMKTCPTALEGFFVLLAQLLNHHLHGIDSFETQLKALQYNMRNNNSRTILENIYYLRQELLLWSDLTTPIEEIKRGAQEAFLESGTNQIEFQRTSLRIERTLSLINHYKQDIETMIHLEEVMSAHRGNEIMKTLTVVTVLFTPGMMLGSIWGMNFKNMPELDWKYGYVYALLAIVVTIAGVYGWLRWKGWTGDLLKNHHRKTRLLRKSTVKTSDTKE
ncbi:Mg2+ transporter protein, CorA-like protein [Fictibacillus macauensis ZFHKF-1]|uniref:Mg2+ transporter protein, CorA-like protein n=1 Tax=Fictibacillus macauensis ZFHKF-1 TaxID=1196324 RepID=I8UKK5_9BACL|nr:magnesium transporter CorA family protein [Fictibacillus macauensis]EIT87415.1 Mg2+ transporter protein, CorA-like protein [Fictibacillus macauensis ZFHKF-1]